jgi:hypothetical protein
VRAYLPRGSCVVARALDERDGVGGP